MRADPSHALQKVIRQRLIASGDVLALVPETNVMDSNGRPEVMPCILIGEGQSVLRRFNATCYATLRRERHGSNPAGNSHSAPLIRLSGLGGVRPQVTGPTHERPS